jgi:hypothetical protein
MPMPDPNSGYANIPPGYVAPDLASQQYDYSKNLTAGGMRDKPISSPWQGVRMMADALSGGYARNQAGQQQAGNTFGAGNDIASVPRPGQPTSLAPPPSATPSPMGTPTPPQSIPSPTPSPQMGGAPPVPGLGGSMPSAMPGGMPGGPGGMVGGMQPPNSMGGMPPMGGMRPPGPMAGMQGGMMGQPPNPMMNALMTQPPGMGMGIA